MRSRHTSARLTTVAITVIAMVCAVGVTVTTPAAAAAANGVITSSGPLTKIQISADLNCAVNHAGDTAGEFFGDTACGTLVAVGGVLYGPASIPAGNSASPRTAWTPQSQSSSGSGTTADPYRLVTVVTGGPVTLTQTDTYAEGSEAYGTRVSVHNDTSSSQTITLYRAADCYLQNSDVGFGRSNATAGSVACAAGADPTSRVEQWAPLTPGSHYYESNYSSVWSVVGSQQPFPDTSDDAIQQDNGAGLSWTSTIAGGTAAAFSHLTSFSPTGSTQVSDSDGDSLPDSWESPTGGVDTNGDGIPDLKLSDYGADPNVPDIFVQVNWTQTRSCTLIFFCSTTNRRPSLAALHDVQMAFLTHGIRLHIDAGPDSVMKPIPGPVTGQTWGSLSQVGGPIAAPSRIAGWDEITGMNWAAAFDGYRNQVLSDERRAIFHEALYVGSFNDDRNSGLARDIGSNDFLLAYDVINGGHPKRIEEAGTFMHELGHTLGLSHGGSVADGQVNWKPNYPSVMNYFWQMSGTNKNNSVGMLDYSQGTLAPIDENALSETAGLEPDSAANNIATRWGCPNGSATQPTPSARNVNWNCSGGITPGTEAANVTGVMIDGKRDTDLTLVSDHNDWSSLVYDGGGALGGAGDPASAPETTPPDTEIPAADLLAVTADPQFVSLSAPGQLNMQTGTSSPVTLTITNHRTTPVTYNLTQITSGLTVTGLPVSVSLSGGQSKDLPVTVAAGSVSTTAFFEVDAANPAEATNAGSATTEVSIVAQQIPDQPPVQGALDHLSLVPATSSAVAGTPTTYTVIGLDAAGNNLGPVTNSNLSIAPDGTCTATKCTAVIAGTHTVTATSGTATGQATLTVTPAAAATVTATAGSGQSTAAGATFATALSARVADSYGNPVPGAQVTFTVSSGATFANGTTSTTGNTGANGQATAPSLKAGSTPGPFTVTASSGSATPATFAETVTAAGPLQADLAVSVSGPSRVSAGGLLTVTVTVNDRGPATANRLLTALTIPRGMQVTSTGGGRVIGGAVVFTTPLLTAAHAASYQVKLKATKAGKFPMVAASLSATRDPVPRNNVARITVNVR